MTLGRGEGKQAAPSLGRRVLRVVAADDEPLALDHIVQLLAERDDVALEEACANGVAALAAIARHRPDVALLDIRMPGLDGFEVIERLSDGPGPLPYLVFVTAFDRYAVEAFRVRAIDYLLKPVTPGRLEDALARAREQVTLRARSRLATDGTAAQSGATWIDDVLVRSGLRDLVIKLADVDWIEADTYYVRLHIGSRSHLLRERMHVLETRLDPRRFARIHRSTIVNLTRVREIKHRLGGEHVVVLTDGTELKASRQRWGAFRALMRARTGRQVLE